MTAWHAVIVDLASPPVGGAADLRPGVIDPAPAAGPR